MSQQGCKHVFLLLGILSEKRNSIGTQYYENLTVHVTWLTVVSGKSNKNYSNISVVKLDEEQWVGVCSVLLLSLSRKPVSVQSMHIHYK